MLAESHQRLADKIWAVANKLRGPYRPPQYREVMLPLIVLRRLDCIERLVSISGLSARKLPANSGEKRSDRFWLSTRRFINGPGRRGSGAGRAPVAIGIVAAALSVIG